MRARVRRRERVKRGGSSAKWLAREESVGDQRVGSGSLESLIRTGEVDTVLTVFADGLGRLMGKRVVGRYFLDHVLEEGVHACIYLFTVDTEMEPLPGFRLTSWERGYGDMKLVPDLDTWRLIPWLTKTALVFCDVYSEDGAPIEEAPRWILRRQVDRARQQGLYVKTGSELELYLFRESFDEARARRYHGLTPVSNYLEDYHILQTSKEEPLVRAIRNHMEAARVPVEFSKGEWGRGQEEINLRYADALEMADRHALYKHGVKEIAWAQGCSVTFMAKYDAAAAGSSCHLHSSVWDPRGKKNLFALKGSREGTPLFQQWLAGQMAMAREFAYFYAPTINAYKRYQAGSFAPTRIACGWDNRTCGFRLCGEGPSFRVENRIPGADANPYLAFAATIAAGLHGIEKKLKPPKLYEGNAYEDATLAQVPKSLREALDELDRSRVAREAFGANVVEHCLHHGRLEQQAFDQAVTDWELIRHFERI
jgi:glutamine synthetase